MANSLALPVIVIASLGLVSPAFSQGFKLPEGDGKDKVAGICGNCHSISRLGAGYTPEGWRTVVRMMLNFRVPIPADQITPITNYLINAFPEPSRPEAVVIPGPTEINIKEWPVPTPGSRPHDPLATRDGAIWYTGQLANVLGRLDPKTGQIKEYPLHRQQTAPHGLAEDAAGNIWFTGNFTGIIGKLDPKTGAVTERILPEAAAGDPHSLVFDQHGVLWFTVQQGNMVGRFDIKNSNIKLVTVPTSGARPYGIQVNSEGIPFFVEFGTNNVASIDPATMQIREYPLPDPSARPRRLAITQDKNIWYTDSARGFLGRLDPATGKVSEWQSPGGPRSQPYGIVATKGALWYSESFTKPNTIVRFDPTSQTFQSWAIPGGGEIVRNMAVTGEGNVALANSLVNEVGLVEIK